MIEYHADDYGLFPAQSRHIADCYYNGALNGISIMPNSPYLKECMDAIEGIRSKLFVTVHLNFVEGAPITGDKAKRLIDKEGNFSIGFGKLLLIGFVPVLRRLYYKAIRREVEAQLLACEPYMNDGKFRIDGHVHYHMLPLVFDAVMDVVKANNLQVSYIRFPREELDVYRRASGKLKGLKAINVVKVLVLNTLAARNERKYREDLVSLNIERKLFMGVMLSGHMFYDNVKECLPHAADILADRGLQDMEILFHPGDVSENEEIVQVTSNDDYSFLVENKVNREKEAEALRKFGGGLKR
ncbi:ChbG/HpnK family deacetylase [Butyrivibrio sp. CB08]|uniref:ChbG/HpnK family deacetylase n=1 Tax=Butyrivibrio sp. CB08 TaxID=2364879 RepID=UPI000EA936B5|nr:ChbG/HpnK family deacetylase [Butyrivibrio sp. CB08]RKM57798.1 ChbG/HpnK family deacetylase [Butyrivibrio sp. CB08]